MGLEGIRKAAQRDQSLKFTALLHHITPELLSQSFYELKRQAAVGVDGVRWDDYEQVVYGRIPELHRKIQAGGYRAFPSRRVYIPKADGKLRMGSSYGFRKGQRSGI